MKFVMHTDFSSMLKMPLGFWILIAAILFTQAVWLFMDANKRGANKWLWGIWGLIQAPTPLILYFLIVRKILSRDSKEKRLRTILIAAWLLTCLILIGIAIIFQD